MRRSLIAAVLLTLVFLRSVVGAQAAATQMSYDESCVNGLSTISFSWSFSAAPLGQWLDLSTQDNGWQRGTFLSAGLLTSTTSRYVWPGLKPGTTHYVRINQPLPGGGWDTSPTWTLTTGCIGAPDNVVYMTQEQFAYAIPCSGQRPPGTEGLPCNIPVGARVVLIAGGSGGGVSGSSFAGGNTETVSILKVRDLDSKVLISRRYGELWLLDYGAGCTSLFLREGRTVLVYSPGIFAGIGAKIILSDNGQSCSIWSATQVS